MTKKLINIVEALLLLEYNRDLTMKQHGPKIVNQAVNAADPHPLVTNVKRGTLDGDSKLFDHIEATDPTPNKKYVQHVARIYGSGGVNRLEDLHSRMRPALARYHELSSKKMLKPEDRDIGKVKSLSHLEDIVDKNADSMSGKEEDRAHHEAMKSQATITEHPDFTHIVPHTAEAAAHFGKGTKWCTATKDINNSMFNDYHSQGPLQIMIPKNPKHSREKYQYHYATGQIMDHEDRHVHDMEGMHPNIAKHIKDYEHKYNNMDVSTALKSPEPAAAENGIIRMTDPEEIHKVFHKVKRASSPNYIPNAIARAITFNRHTSEKTLSGVIDNHDFDYLPGDADYEHENGNVIMNTVHHPNVRAKHIGKMVENGVDDWNMGSHMSETKNNTLHHEMIHSKDENVQCYLGSIVKHASSENLHALLDKAHKEPGSVHINDFNKENMLNNPNFTPEHKKKLDALEL